MKSAEHFEVLVEEHYEPLFRFALSLTRAEADASDLTQHAFYALAAKGHQLRDFSKVKAWLFTTLYRAYLHMRRRQARFSNEESEQVSEQQSGDSPESGSPMDAAQALSALGQLDQVYQAPVALFYLEDYTYKEIARVLEVPMGTVKSRISRGIGQLKKILVPDHPDEGHPAQKTTRTPAASEHTSTPCAFCPVPSREPPQFSVL